MDKVIVSRRMLAWLAAAMMLAGPASAGEIRTWRYRDTGDSFLAEFIGITDGKLLLCSKKDGKTITVAPSELSLADLVYAFERTQQPPAAPESPEGQESAVRAETAPVSAVAGSTPAEPPGTCQIEIESRKALEEELAEKIRASLSGQFASHGPLPANTTTFVRLTLGVRSEEIERYRFRDSSIAVHDVVARWRIVILRRSTSRSSPVVTLFSGDLEVTSAKILGGAPEKPVPAITRDQLSEIVGQAAVEAVCAWRIPEEVFAGKKK